MLTRSSQRIFNPKRYTGLYFGEVETHNYTNPCLITILAAKSNSGITFGCSGPVGASGASGAPTRGRGAPMGEEGRLFIYQYIGVIFKLILHKYN